MAEALSGIWFCVTSHPDHSKSIIELFNKVKIDANIVGKVTDDLKLKLTDNTHTRVLFDFKKDIITGIKNNKEDDTYERI